MEESDKIEFVGREVSPQKHVKEGLNNYDGDEQT